MMYINDRQFLLNISNFNPKLPIIKIKFHQIKVLYGNSYLHLSSPMKDLQDNICMQSFYPPAHHHDTIIHLQRERDHSTSCEGTYQSCDLYNRI